MLSFLKSVFYKLPTKCPQAAPDGNMGTRWAVGTFLGYSRNSNCYLVGTANGVIPARSLQRRPAEERWRADEVAQVQATPWSVHERPEVEVRFREPAAERADAPGATRQASLRQMRISKADLGKYVYIVGCPLCRHFEEYGVSKPGGVHTALCRARLVEEM